MGSVIDEDNLRINVSSFALAASSICNHQELLSSKFGGNGPLDARLIPGDLGN